MPTKRRGNGHGPTVHELALAAALGWGTNVVVVTKARHRGFPNCYKLDVGNTALKIGVEVDGYSHCAMSRKSQDRKKEAFLNSIGWKVLRFSNKEVAENLNACVQKVLSII